MREFLITENDAGQRLDKFLQKALPTLPKGALCKAVRTKNIKRNGGRCAINDRLAAGDVLRLYLRDELLGAEKTAAPPAFLTAGEELRVVYEDARVLVVNKPVGLVVHTDDHGGTDTLVNRVLRYLYTSGAYDPAAEQSFVPALCNRLDRNTGGLVLAAKTAEALRAANEAIRLHTLQKQYLCVTASPPPAQAALAVAYHFRAEGARMVEVSKTPREGFSEIRTEYRVLAKRPDGRCLLEVTLHTGRTHQIRAHLAALGAPLLGDEKYGKPAANRAAGEQHQLLFAQRLVLPPSLGGAAVCVPMDEIPFVARYFPQRTAQSRMR